MNGDNSPACAEHVKAFEEALSDDLNVPQALGIVHECLRSDVPPGAKKKLLELAEKIFAIGLFQKEDALEPALAALVAQREAARKNKDFALADTLRGELDRQGILVEDTKQGQKWRKK